MLKKALIGYGVDVDAVAGWINTGAGAPANATDISRGVFGATVGVERLLRLWEKYGITTSWFVPGHSAESFPAMIESVVRGGHEVGLHGYTHEHVHTLSKEQEEDVLIKSIDVLRGFTGQKPQGWTAPAWSTSEHSIALLEKHGIMYDHSLMHHDSQLYYAPYTARTWAETDTTLPAARWMTPMAHPGVSSVVEVPANWHLDDWPPLQPKMATGAGFTDTHVVERLWKEQFEYHYRECSEGGSFVFPISVHPQVSGKPQVLLMHERLIEWFRGHEGVEFCTFGEMVDRFKRGEIGGTSVEFGGLGGGGWCWYG